MIVVSHTEPVLDKICDHRACPHTAGVAKFEGTGLNQIGQFVLLLLIQLSLRARPRSSRQTRNSFGFIALEPSIDRTSSDVGLLREFNNATSLNVAQDRTSPAPSLKVIGLSLLLDKPLQSTLRWTSSPVAADSATGFGTGSICRWHDPGSLTNALLRTPRPPR